jgi:hypothetical protein
MGRDLAEEIQGVGGEFWLTGRALEAHDQSEVREEAKVAGRRGQVAGAQLDHAFVLAPEKVRLSEKGRRQHAKGHVLQRLGGRQRTGS